MGTLTVPTSGHIYLDTNCFIYSIERIAPYYQLLDALWRDIHSQGLTVITSELTLLETLVGPLRTGNQTLEGLFRTVLLTSPDVRLVPITLEVLDLAAHLRATAGLKTPDAIHAATALETGATLCVTNDAAFRRVPGLVGAVLGDFLTP